MLAIRTGGEWEAPLRFIGPFNLILLGEAHFIWRPTSKFLFQNNAGPTSGSSSEHLSPALTISSTMAMIKVAKLTEMPPGSLMGVEVEGKYFLLANVNGALFAMDGLCSHMAGRLWEGTLEGTVVKCPRHGSRFDVRTGEVVSQVKIPLIGKAKPMKTYRTVIEGQDVLIDL